MDLNKILNLLEDVFHFILQNYHKSSKFFFTFQRKHLASEPTEEGSCRPSRPKSRNIDIRYIQIDKNSRERERD